MRWLSILVLALALVAAGCGGGDDDSSASGDTTVEETTTTTDTSEDTTTDDGTGTTGDFDFADEDCQALLGVGATIAAAFSGTGDANTDELEDLASKVPDEIKADVETLAQAFNAYAQKLQEIGIEAGATPTAEQVQELQTAIASLDQDELTAASQRLEAWAQQNCQS
jgi:ABC-type glycerol-3-phosphate transport system substrate-binding protein